MSIESAVAEWKQLLGEAAVLPEEDASRTYGSCTTGEEARIPAAIKPARRDQVAGIVSIAARWRIPLYPISTGHNWGYGCAVPAQDGCVLLDLSALASITAFDPDLGIVTVEPGVTQEMLARFLETHQAPFLVPVTGAGPSASILGNALERGYGITPISDHFLAVQTLEAVLPDGRIYRPALAEMGAELADGAYKWGIGPYLDGLFAQGNAGIVTAMTIALARRPDRTLAFMVGIPSDDAIGTSVEAIRSALQQLPGLVGGINLMNRRRVLAMATPFPNAAVGPDGVLTDAAVTDLARKYRIAPWTVFGTLYGNSRTTAAAKRVIREILGPVGRRLTFVSPSTARRLRRLAERLPGAAAARLASRAALLEGSLDLVAGQPSETALPLAYWKLASGTVPDRRLDPSRDGCGLIWYAPLVVMKGEIVTRYVEFVTGTLLHHGMEPLVTLTSLSDRCFDSSVPLLFDRNNPGAVARANACYRALLDEGAREGFLPYRVGIGAMDWLAAHDTVAWEIIGNLRRTLDPYGIVSPGRYSPSAPYR